ncbi:MAG: ATP-binding cassette domain-containing protein [Candidatus Nitrosopelagicus sp.]|nr:ATP-binding cassette domain-containing protein [Candidatus Nitrosopelagicus sp.]
MKEILKVESLTKKFKKKNFFSSDSKEVTAADSVSFSLQEGEILAIAGQSGSGKSTIAKLILRAIEPDSGKIFHNQKEIRNNSDELKKFRMKCQMIYQDPYDSINPRMTISDIIEEPLEIHNLGTKNERKQRVIETLQKVKLEPAEEIAKKYPHMLSGGQRQRVVIARAIVVKPEIIIADEPVSMLDVSIRAEILELMKDIQKENNISMIYITHDLATAKHFADNILILNSGKIMEIGSIEKVLSNPENPYTKALIAAVSEPDPKNLYKEKKILFE